MANFNNLLTCANTNLAHNGANTDITSLGALSTQITVPQGGTNKTTLTAHAPLIGEGTSAVTDPGVGTAGQPLLSSGAGVDPAWGTLGVTFGGTGNVAISADQVFTGTAANTLTAKSVPNCTDVSGQHLNYLTASHAWACGTSLIELAGSYRNLKITAAGGVKTQTVTADAVSVSSAADAASFLCEALSATLDISANGAVNKLDTGTVAPSTLYFTFAISNGSTCGTLASTSRTTPTLPAGYTMFARIGAFFTDASSNVLAGTQLGNNYRYVTPVKLANGAAGVYSALTPTWAAQTTSGAIPSSAAKYTITIINEYNNGAAQNVLAAPNNSYGGIQSTTAPPPLFNSSNGVAEESAELLYESSNVYWVSGGNGGAIFCNGWQDNL